MPFDMILSYTDTIQWIALTNKKKLIAVFHTDQFCYGSVMNGSVTLSTRKYLFPTTEEV